MSKFKDLKTALNASEAGRQLLHLYQAPAGIGVHPNLRGRLIAGSSIIGFIEEQKIGLKVLIAAEFRSNYESEHLEKLW